MLVNLGWVLLNHSKYRLGVIVKHVGPKGLNKSSPDPSVNICHVLVTFFETGQTPVTEKRENKTQILFRDFQKILYPN